MYAKNMYLHFFNEKLIFKKFQAPEAKSQLFSDILITIVRKRIYYTLWLFGSLITDFYSLVRSFDFLTCAMVRVLSLGKSPILTSDFLSQDFANKL